MQDDDDASDDRDDDREWATWPPEMPRTPSTTEEKDSWMDLRTLRVAWARRSEKTEPESAILAMAEPVSEGLRASAT